MTKAEIIEEMAEAAGITKAVAAKSLDAFVENIRKSLKKDRKVTLVGFGTFAVSKRKARKGRNPQTGAAINIPASKVPRFSAGKAFKDAIK